MELRAEDSGLAGPSRRAERRRFAEQLAHSQAGIVSRRQLYAAGITRSEVRANLRALRWRAVGRQCICVHRGPLTRSARHWAAVLEAGPRARLDGASALVHAGVKNFEPVSIRVSVPRGARVYRRLSGVEARQTRRWSADDVIGTGLPRARPAVAAIHAALWARSNREAALVLTMTVQQGIADAQALSREMLKVRRDRRRGFIHGVLHDLLDGVRSLGELGELDVARECRERDLPEPSRQALRRAKNGSYYLDVYWERWRLVVEIDGIQHAWVSHIVGDALRQNSLALDGDTVLRLPLLGLRVAPEEFFAQIEQALSAAGCPIPGRLTA
jgi:very-short-patch-repair endonuclease